MNRRILALLTASTVALAAAGGVAAQEAQLSDSAAAGLAALGVQTPEGAALTDDQAARIENVLGSDDDDQTKIGRIDQILAEPAAAGSASASDNLKASVGADLAALGIDTAGVDSLSFMQLAEIENVTGSQDDDAAKTARIERILAGEMEGQGMGPDATMLMDAVGADLAALGVEGVDVGALSLTQLAEIENVTGSTDDGADKRARIETILNM